MARHGPAVARIVGTVRGAFREAGVVSGTRVAVAYSGGPDSTALLCATWILRRRLGLTVAALHVDHGLRPESAREAADVLRAARRIGVDVWATRLSLGNGSQLAARARRARYEALLAGAREVGAGVVALGHTATDQAETVLLHLARGCGARGLGGMPEVFDHGGVRFVRPLLTLSRAAVAEAAASLAEQARLVVVDDPTNHDARLPRVAVRERVLPALRAARAATGGNGPDQDPGLDERVALAAEAVRDAARAVERWADEVWGRCFVAGALQVADWAHLPRAVRRAVLARLVAAPSGGAPWAPDPRRHGAIQPVIAGIDRALLERRTGAAFDLFGGRIAVVERVGKVQKVLVGPRKRPSAGAGNH